MRSTGSLAPAYGGGEASAAPAFSST